MIDRDTKENLPGQTELTDILPPNPAQPPEGYDESGHLINPASPSPCHCEERSDVAIRSQVPDPDARLETIKTEITTILDQTRGVVIGAALQIGKRLLEVRQLVPQGRFGEWIRANLDYSERKAQDLMRLYEQYGRGDTIPDSIQHLDYSQAVLLLSAPEDVRDALAAKAADEGLSVRQLQQEIRDIKAERDLLQTQMDVIAEERDKVINNAFATEDAIRREREAAKLADARAKAAEASAEELRKMRSDAEDRAAQSAQRASDAVSRANQAAKELAEARAKIAELTANPPEPERVEVVPESVTRELEQLKIELAQAKAVQAAEKTPAAAVTATDKFKWFYANQMKPAFTTALALLREVAAEDPHAADVFATALTNGCKQLMTQLGGSA